MKKTISLILVLTVLLSSFSMFVYADEFTDESATYAVQLLKSLNIVQGDENGNLNYYDKVTRAEFAKMAVASSSYRNSVAVTSNVSPFPDVKYTYWGATYIKTAVDAGYINGYPDSTFRPESFVLLEEGVTICLKLLGYSDTDFIGMWPQGQMAKANDLELLDNVSCVTGEYMSRIDVMNLIYNTLSCNTKTGTNLMSSFNYICHQDAVIVMNNETDPDVDENKIVTSKGVLKFKSKDVNLYVGYKGDLYLDSNNYITAFVPKEKLDEDDYKAALSAQGYTVYEDEAIIMTSEFDSEITKGKVVTSKGALKYRDESVNWYIGYEGDIYLDSDGEIMKFAPKEKLSDDDYKLYLSAQGYVTYDDVVIIATSNEDSSVAANKIVTSDGTFTVNSDFDKTLSGRKGKLIVKVDPSKGNTVFSFVPCEQIIENYTLNTVLDNSILVYSGNVSSAITLDTETVIYYKSSQGTASTIKNMASLGDTVKVYKDTNGKVDYITIGSGSMSGPYILSTTEMLYSMGANSSTKYYRDGKSVEATDLNVNDVVYYSKEINAVWAYSDKVAGVYESASPSKDNITTVTVSGKTYGIETAQAYSKLVTGGAYNFGDSVILLLGKNGQVADVISTVNNIIYGYVTEASSKSYTYTSGETYTSNYVEVMLADGSTFEYKVNKNYSSYISSLCSIKVTNGIATLNKVTTGNTGITGNFVYGKMRIGSTFLAEDVEILDVMTTSSADTPAAVTVYPQRLDGCTISSSDVLYYTKNSEGKIDMLFLNDFTGDGYLYGIVSDVSFNTGNTSSRPSSYSVYADGNVYTTNIAKSFAKGDVLQIYVSPSARVEKANELIKVPGKITEVDYTSLKTSNTTYKISGNVRVYMEKRIGADSQYYVAAMSDINENTIVEAYYTSSSDKLIRVIVIKN